MRLFRIESLVLDIFMLIGIDASRVSLKEKTGTETYASSLIKAIAKVDQRNQYLLYFNSNQKVNFINQVKFQEIDIPAQRLWTQCRLSRELFRQKPDILFIPAHTLPIIRPKNIKTVVTIHDLGAEYLKEYYQFPQRIYLNRTTEYVLKYATHIITVSEATKREIEERFGRKKNLTVIPEGYNSEIYDFAKLKAQSFENTQDKKSKLKAILNKYNLIKPYLLFVGTIQPRKNLTRLIKAFAKVKNKDLELVLVGKKGWLYDDIFQLPGELGIKNKVRFLNYVDLEDLPFLYYQAKAFVFPSLCEGFGLPLLEAMACGCPVLTSNISSMPEIVEKAGFLVNPYHEDEIQQGIENIVNNVNLQKRLRENGLQKVKNFSWEKAARETMKVFEKLR